MATLHNEASLAMPRRVVRFRDDILRIDGYLEIRESRAPAANRALHCGETVVLWGYTGKEGDPEQ